MKIMDNFSISIEDVLKFQGSEKMLYASNGKGVQMYITLNGGYLVYVSGKIHVETTNVKKAVDYFNDQCKVTNLNLQPPCAPTKEK